MTVFAAAAVSGCTGSAPRPSVPTFSPAGSISPAPTALSSGAASESASPSASPPASSPSATRQPEASHFPTAAPATGGGGTAGLQDALLLAAGGAAVLAGAGSLAYRRRITRGR